MLKSLFFRVIAVFAASGLSVIGAGAIAGIPLWKAAMVAGIGGVATVVESLARGFLDDGKLDEDEINSSFAMVDKSKKKAEAE